LEYPNKILPDYTPFQGGKMSKVKNPLSSLGATGKFSENIIFQKQNRQYTAKKLSRPYNPRTARQLSVRDSMHGLTLIWRTLTDEQRESWTLYAYRRNRDGYSTFLSANFSQYHESGTYDEWAPGYKPTPQNWYDPAWLDRILITFDHTKVMTAAPLENYPAYIDLSLLNPLFFSLTKNNGGDIRFTTSDGKTEIPRELVNIDTGAGTGQAFVKIPSLSNSAPTSIYVYFNNPAAFDYDPADPYGRHNTWPSDYLIVHHMNDLTTNTLLDSTTNNYTSTKKAENEPVQASGKLGYCQQFDGTNDYTKTAATLELGSTEKPNFSISAWLYISAAPPSTKVYKASQTTGALLLSIKNNGYSIGASLICELARIVYGPTTCAFCLITWTRNGSDLRGYHNAIEKKKQTQAYDWKTGNIVYGIAGNLVSEPFPGKIDHFTIQNRAVQQPELETTYNNQNDPGTFYTGGPIEEY